MMHDIKSTRALPNVITCMMHDITCTRALPIVITCIACIAWYNMHDAWFNMYESSSKGYNMHHAW